MQLDDRHQEGVVVGGRRLRRLQHPLGLVEVAELVERLAEQQPDLGRHAVERRGPAEPLDLREVVAVARQPGCLQEQIGVGRAGRLEPRRRHTDRVLAATSAVGVDAVGRARAAAGDA